MGPVLQDLLTLLDTRHAPVGINLESVPSDFCGLLGCAAHSFFPVALALCSEHISASSDFWPSVFLNKGTLTPFFRFNGQGINC